MDALLLDKEFNDYWSMLTPIQKESLLSVVKSFVQPKEKPGHTSLEQYTMRKTKEVAEKPMNDYTNDPFFIKKRQLGLKLLQKAGLPDSFARSKR